jgi:glycosyltransferase involved in cell wall biosynthesis
MERLAIVIPAFKQKFLDATLQSLSRQTSKRFTIYIGDDNSPESLKEICDRYASCMSIVYRKFDENLGGKNLVDHWNRCLQMVGGEEWIMLFSDDDTLDRNCIQNFYNEIDTADQTFDVYHFDINVIDENGNLNSSSHPFPDNLSAKDFMLERSAGRIKSYVVEYIFNRRILKELGGFVNFPIAWHSDEATVIYAAKQTGIKTISESRVNWRSSQYNITPNAKSKDVVLKKTQASIDFSVWLHEFAASNDIQFSYKMSFYLIKRFCYELHMYRHILPFKKRLDIQRLYLKNLGLTYLLPISLFITARYILSSKR